MNVIRPACHRKRGAALESAILDAAWHELTSIGYSGFSVESVAARARTGKASIYRRWPTKPELVLDCLCSNLPVPLECGIGTFPDSVSTIEALHQIGRSIGAVVSGPAGDAILAIKASASDDPELARAIDERFNAPRRDALLALLRRGVERGEVRPDAVCSNVAEVLPAVLSYRAMVLREKLTPDSVVRIIDEVLVPLVAVKAGRESEPGPVSVGAQPSEGLR